MRRIPLLIAGAAVATVLTACSATAPGAADTPATSSAVPGEPAVSAEEAGVETVFHAYYQALLARDFATACALNAPETNQQLLHNAAAGGLQSTSCEDALTRIYAVPGAAETSDGIARSARVQDVAITGDTATISWDAETHGERRTARNIVRMIEGQWRLVDVNPR
ncbi:hypothetical protein ACVGVM_14485 [Pseudonocardia bannensis]|uniref:DUF4878 domain-containing protein n=1 Tax=Pseudonocardia bannensis TaxID=630973 RepID=A0A848DR36_9PSEU|nr:hypothetical protein [Pseudonocardia bannensis]NMH94851.1 hypothetical protein [Pseudonocardia bannensis]